MDTALGGGLSSVGLSESSLSVTATIETRLFFVIRGDDATGEHASSFLLRSAVGLDVGTERVSWIRLLLRRFREGLEPSIGDCGKFSAVCMVDLTYCLGTLKNVATGGWGAGGEVRIIGGNTRLAIILAIDDEVAELMNLVGRRHSSLSR